MNTRTRTVTCSMCREPGHNCRTCPMRNITLSSDLPTVSLLDGLETLTQEFEEIDRQTTRELEMLSQEFYDIHYPPLTPPPAPKKLKRTKTPKLQKPYIQEGNQKSSLVTVEPGGDVADLGTLKVTALDVASTEAGIKQGAEGGPNRTNATNQYNTVGSDGTYKLTRYPDTRNNFTPTPSNGTPLKDRDGKDVPNQELQAYSPTRTYMDYMIEQKSKLSDKI